MVDVNARRKMCTLVAAAFIDGHFAKSFDPITDTEITRDEDGNFVQTESDTKAIEAVEPETEIIVEEEDYVTT